MSDRDTRYIPFFQVADVNGCRVVFSNVEFDEKNPPHVIEIDGWRWVRSDLREQPVEYDLAGRVPIHG